MTRSPSTAAAVAAAVVLAVSTGCGIGEGTPEGKVAESADEYLRALAADDAEKACSQLAGRAKEELGRPCAEEMHAIARRIGADPLSAAADRGLDVRVAGARGFAEVRELGGSLLTFGRFGEEWRIVSGHALDDRAGAGR